MKIVHRHVGSKLEALFKVGYHFLHFSKKKKKEKKLGKSKASYLHLLYM